MTKPGSLSEDGERILVYAAEIERMFAESPVKEQKAVNRYIAVLQTLLDVDDSGEDHAKSAIAIVAFRNLAERPVT